NQKLRVVVIGGGWAGYSFCESISTNNINEKQGVEIILLDASKQAKGGLAGGYRDGSSNNRPVEAGIHGFWREYRNTFDIMNGIDATTSKTPPMLTDFSEEGIRRFVAANLPPPLDLPILAKLDDSKTSAGGSKLSILDLASGIGLLGAWADFEQESPISWRNYDTQPASVLFEKAGITDALFEELVSPLLHVLPMCPAYDCSAAAALSCFHVFALQSRGAFDVRWCRGSISEKIFEPWQKQLEKRSVTVRGGARVASIYTIQLDSQDEVGNDTIQCDAVVLAVGATAAGKLASSSQALSALPVTRDFDKLRGVTCVAVRLFLKPHQTVTSDLNGVHELKETGFCIYDLQRMHDEFSSDQVAVLEVDFYRADAFVDFNNDEIVELALEAVAAALGTAKIDSDNVVDSTVLKARNAVSHFAPDSALYSPNVKMEEGMYICGDWIDRTGYASWSTEKSVVTARQAADALSKDFRLKKSEINVIPAAKDTPQLTALRQSARVLRSLLPPKTLP
ncbi:hypothetical protein THAPSDRAFT_261310, partial [Thalassiosira pseudonana CCMP1335]